MIKYLSSSSPLIWKCDLAALSCRWTTLSTDWWGFSPPRWSSFAKRYFFQASLFLAGSPLTTSHLSSSDDLSKIPLRFWQKALIVLNWELLVFIIFLVVALMTSKHAEVVRIFWLPESSSAGSWATQAEALLSETRHRCHCCAAFKLKGEASGGNNKFKMQTWSVERPCQ